MQYRLGDYSVQASLLGDGEGWILPMRHEDAFPDAMRDVEPGVAEQQGRSRWRVRTVLFDFRRKLRLTSKVRERAAQAPDLLAALGTGHPERSWVAETADTIGELDARDREMRLLRCELREGPLGLIAISAIDETQSLNVRIGDTVNAGFVATSDEEGGLQVRPRIYRRVCANGSIAFSHEQRDLLREEGSVAAAIRNCLSRTTLQAVGARLKRAADARLSDALGMLTLARVHSPLREVATAFARQSDQTVWGLINVVTARARSERDFARRLDLETDAERILCAMEGSLDREGGVTRRARNPEGLLIG